MEPLFIEANSTIEQISTLFNHLEKRQDPGIEESIKAKLDGLQGTFDRLELYILKEPAGKRQTSRLRLNQLKYDKEHLYASLQQAQRRRERRERDTREREELLNRRFTTNNTSINIDHSIQHHNSLQHSNSAMDDMLAQGRHILTSLQDQRGILKNTKKRILDFTSTLGLSNTVMKMIERRSAEDKFIFYIGMIVTCAIIFFVYFYFV